MEETKIDILRYTFARNEILVGHLRMILISCSYCACDIEVRIRGGFGSYNGGGVVGTKKFSVTQGYDEWGMLLYNYLTGR